MTRVQLLNSRQRIIAEAFDKFSTYSQNSSGLKPSPHVFCPDRKVLVTIETMLTAAFIAQLERDWDRDQYLFEHFTLQLKWDQNHS